MTPKASPSLRPCKGDAGESCFEEEDVQFPWMSMEVGFCRGAAAILEHENFDTVIGIIIVINVFLMILDTNANATCETTSCSGPVLVGMGFAFLGVYTCELLVRLFVFQLQACKSAWMWLDIAVVLSGYLDIVLRPLFKESFQSGGDVFKLLRIARLVRAVRFVGLFPSLRGILRGFVSAVKAMIWGLLAMTGLLMIFSLLAVELVHPEHHTINHKDLYCKEAFVSVQSSLFFFIQNAIVGDQWACITPVILDHWYLGLMFVAVYALVQFGLMNLILSAVIDEAYKAHDLDVEERLIDMKAEEAHQLEMLGPVFKEIDLDGSGTLTAEELLHAYRVDPRLQQVLSLLRIDEEGLLTLFQLMDSNGDGDINYEEFTKCMKAAQVQDIRMQMMTLKLHVLQLVGDLGERVASVAENVGRLSAMSRGSGPVTFKEVSKISLADASTKLPEGAAKPKCVKSSLPGEVVVEGLATLESELREFQQGVHLQVEQFLRQQLDHGKRGSLYEPTPELAKTSNSHRAPSYGLTLDSVDDGICFVECGGDADANAGQRAKRPINAGSFLREIPATLADDAPAASVPKERLG